MSATARLRVREPSVVHETIDGEVVIINLDTGAYYSLDKSGVDVWDALVCGASLEELNAALSARCEESPTVLAKAIRELVDELQQEELIAPDGTVDNIPLVPHSEETSSRKPFERWTLQKYSDMTQLLLLDPIHDVDEPGWPTPRAGSASTPSR